METWRPRRSPRSASRGETSYAAGRVLAFMEQERPKRCRWWIDENDQLRVGWLIVAVLVVVMVVGYVFACGVAQSLDAQRDHWWFELWAYRFTQDGAWFDVARTTATLVAIPGAAIALVIAFARHRVSQQQVAVSQQQAAHAIDEAQRVHERETDRQKSVDRQLDHAASESRALEKREIDRRVNEQYVQAVDQLRDGSAVARIAGMHALDRLAQEQAGLRSIVVDVWCAYLRIKRPSESGQIQADEREVRATCTRLLLGHLRADRNALYWGGDTAIQIDLSGADLSAHWDAFQLQFPYGSRFDEAVFGRNARFNAARFGDSTSFISARFGHGVEFRYAEFGEHVRFDGAEFGRYADFGEASFGEGLQFHGASFGNNARFSGAEFGDYIWFPGAAFGDRVKFDKAQFGNSIRFDGATFGNDVQFDGATFGSGVRFDKATLGNEARFVGAAFGDHARFEGARFGDQVRFGGATFGNHTRFDGAEFGDGGRLGAEFGIHAQFDGAAFGDETRFVGATFGRHARLAATRFGDRARFDASTFGEEAVFDDAVFGKHQPLGNGTWWLHEQSDLNEAQGQKDAVPS